MPSTSPITIPAVTLPADTLAPTAQRSVDRFVAFLETGGEAVPDGLFAPEVFADLSFPTWRVQVEGGSALAEARRRSHPQAGTVRLEKVTATSGGWALKLEERWEDGGQRWYCREGFLADLDEQGLIAELTLYCTGDWDEARVAEHARAVALLRP